MFGSVGFYLVSDGTPLNQRYARYRVAKHGHISIKGMKNVPQNELISVGLTNGIIYIPLLWDIWVSPKVCKKRDYKTKTDIFLNLLKKFLEVQELNLDI